ncbi:MAG: hypothetical protein WBO44_00975, partial [Saprospiraceae bacterium]
MEIFKVLIYEDDTDWVDGFEFNIKPKLSADNIDCRIYHRLDDSTLMQDLEWIPQLILIDHDLGTQVGTEIISQIQEDPQFRTVSIFYYSGGESIEDLKRFASSYQCSIHCYVKQG